MFDVERRMGTYKIYFHYYAHLDDSISKSYIVDGAITFLSRYLNNNKTRSVRMEHNWDAYPLQKYSMEIFDNKTRTLGAPTFGLVGDSSQRCTIVSFQ